ncbi:hypothetical protein AA14362_1940 [Acetobacter cerevisiae DSM 14362]|nr:hypothetical protein AA14362_1940 [Acetobacter cerevisiae DSM 14362]
MGAAAIMPSYGVDRQHLSFAIKGVKCLKRRMQPIKPPKIQKATLLPGFRKNKVPPMCFEVSISIRCDSREAIQCAAKKNNHKAWVVRPTGRTGKSKRGTPECPACSQTQQGSATMDHHGSTPLEFG